MFKLSAAIFFVLACSLVEAKPGVLLAAAPAGVVTATSSQYVARNFNGIASAPIVAPVATAAYTAPIAAAAYTAPIAAAYSAPVAAAYTVPAAAAYTVPAAAAYTVPAAYPYTAAYTTLG